MITFKLKEKEYTIPEYINIENYTKIFKIKNLLSDQYFAAKLINIVTGAEIEDLLENDYQNIELIASYILSLLPQERPPFIDRFTIDGVDYGFFPDWKELTYAEYVDMDTISTKKSDEVLDLLHVLAAVMYRPIVEEKGKHEFKIEKYDTETVKDRSELFKKKMDVSIILGAQFFFINFGKKYLSYSQISSITKLTMWEKIKLLWKLRRWVMIGLSKKSMDGSLSQTKLLETILRNTDKSIKVSS